MQFETLRMVKKNRVMVWCCVVVAVMTIIIIAGKGAENNERRSKKQMDRPHTEKRKSIFLTDHFAKLQDPFRLQRPQDKIVQQVKTERKINREIGIQSPEMGIGKLVLTGLVESAGERIAIIEIDKKSGMYREHEKIGAYEIIQIAQNNVVLLKGKGGYVELKVMRQ